MIQAFHSFWSRPNTVRNNGSIVMTDCELLVLMLSALKWQQINGPICMITDSVGADFLVSNGLENLWSEPLDTRLDDLDRFAVDPFLFWAAGKLYALALMAAPCAMVDTDLIIWEEIGGIAGDHVVCAHAESLDIPVYREPDVFRMHEGYTFPSEWNWCMPPVNTAFLYMPDEDLKGYYVGSAFAFMKALDEAQVDPSVTMCFAEQRILPMCVDAAGGEMTYLFAFEDRYTQTVATHLWGLKRRLAQSESASRSFCERCVLRITTEFPEFADVVCGNLRLHQYV